MESPRVLPGSCRSGTRCSSRVVRPGSIERGGLLIETRQADLKLACQLREILSVFLDNVEDVSAEGASPQKKDLLPRLVKKVLVHDKRTIEIWYALPNQPRLGHWVSWLPECLSLLTGAPSRSPSLVVEFRGLSPVVDS